MKGGESEALQELFIFRGLISFNGRIPFRFHIASNKRRGEKREGISG